MDTTAADPLEDPRVFLAVQEYQTELDAGRRPDRAAFVARHPDIAEALAGCLDGLDFLLAATPHAAPAPDVRLGEFQLLREVGRGGMGVVYEAEQVSLGRRVAVKVLSSAAPDDRARQRFRNEAHAAASLAHPHIVPVYAVGADGDTLFLAMRFVRGRSLAVCLRDWRSKSATGDTARPDGTAPDVPAEPVVDPDPPVAFPAPSDPGYHRAVGRLIAAADALHHAHECGIVHRDIKPGNLLLGADGHPWVTDFGLARLPGAGDLTRTGEMLGTLRYMSPEQAAGGAVDRRADVYSLGATLYELLTLRPAFAGTDAADLLRRVAAAEPPGPRAVAPSIPRDLETVVLKAMAKEPAERYVTARELADDLGRFLEDRPVRARRPSVPHRLRKWAKRNRALVAAALVVLFAFLAFAVVGLTVSANRVNAERELTAKANGDLTRANADLTVALLQARQAEYTYRFLDTRRHWLAGNFARAADLLRECPPEHRCWEWGYLNNLLDAGLWTLPAPPKTVGATLGPLVFSADGSRLADLGPSVRVWELPADLSPPAAPRWTFSRPKWSALGVVFTLDGKHLVAAGYDGQQPGSQPLVGELHAWDLATGQLVRSVLLPGKPLALSPDGTRVLCSPRLTAQLIDTADGKPVPGFADVPATTLHLVTFSPSGQSIGVPGGGGLQLYDAVTGRLVRTFADPRGAEKRVAFSPDERFAATVTGDGVAKVWELATGKEVHVLRGREAQSPAFSPDGRRLVTVGTGGTLAIWDVCSGNRTTAGTVLHTIHGPSRGSPAFHPDGLRLATRGAAGAVTFWDATTDHEGRELPRWPLLASGFTVSGDGSRVVRPGIVAPPGQPPSNLTRVIELATGRESRRAPEPVPRVAVAVIGRAGSAALGSADGLFVRRPATGGAWAVWDATTGREKLLGGSERMGFSVAAVSADGATLAVGGSKENAVRLFDPITGAPKGELAVGRGSVAVTFHPAGPLLAVACDDRTVRLFDVAAMKAVHSLAGHTGTVKGIAFHPGGALLASVGADGTARLWDARTGECLRVIDAHAGGLHAVAFTPDGERMVVAVPRGSLQVWDHRSGEQYLTVGGEKPLTVKRLEFTPDGRFLLGDDNIELTVWDSAVADGRDKVARLAGRAAGWRAERAKQSETAKDWFPAVFHLERLAALEPANAEYRTRLEKAKAALAASPKK